jgi:hypothetical protein
MYCVQAILKSSHRKRMTDDKKISQRCRSHIILMRLRRRVKKLQGDTAAQKKTKFTMLRRLYILFCKVLKMAFYRMNFFNIYPLVARLFVTDKEKKG